MLYPCGHRVLVKTKEIETEKDLGNGLKLSVVVNERLEKAAQIEGTVIAIGPDAWKAFRAVDDEGRWVNGRPWAKVGDRVYYARYAGHSLKDPETGEDLTILNDEDITCIITGEDNATS